MANKRECVFCGNTNLSKEHIFAQWLSKELNIFNNDVLMTHANIAGMPISNRKHAFSKLVNGLVCETCNNGWMSQLEGDCQNHIINLMNMNELETELAFLNEHHETVAKWAFKNVILLNSATNYRHLVPDEHYKELYSGKIPEGVFIKELVSDKYFAKEIEKRIGVQTDTTAIDKELANYESKLKEVDLNKARLEREIDNLPIDARFRERKIHDMTLRLDGLYDTIVELEERIEDAKLRKSSIEMEAITLDNIYKLMLNFGKLYDIISDEEKKSLITYLIKEIQIYPNGESEQPLKSIEFNFPIYRDGQEVRRLLWEKGNTVETVCLLSKRSIMSM